MSSWRDMNALERRAVPGLTRAGIPLDAGVYALYRDDAAMYVGKATSLRSRLWDCHLSTGKSMTNSAMRRNVAQFLEIANAADIKTRRYLPTDGDARRVSDWIRECELAWVECENEPSAKDLEDALKREWKPPLTRI
ncbi:MAG: hypothetical protein M3540_02190 [Actinomycetota bacterium]|nr:hypothetical protein [Actinomycetota bacterium]